MVGLKPISGLGNNLEREGLFRFFDENKKDLFTGYFLEYKYDGTDGTHSFSSGLSTEETFKIRTMWDGKKYYKEALSSSINVFGGSSRGIVKYYYSLA